MNPDSVMERKEESFYFNQEHTEDVKHAVNNLLWMYGPGGLRLSEAEERANEILNIIRRDPE